MEIKLDDYDIKRMAEKAIADQIWREFDSGYSPLKKRFQTGLDKALTDLEPEIDKAMRRGISEALASPAFQGRLQESLLKACSDKFGGAMNAIMKAAAKRAATDAGLQKDVENAVVSAVQR